MINDQLKSLVKWQIITILWRIENESYNKFGEQKKDLFYLTILILFIGGTTCLFCFYIFPMVMNEESNFSLEPIQLNPKWENVSEFRNTERPFPWLVKNKDKSEIPIDYNSLIDFYDQGRIIEVKYVIEKNHIKLYGLEEVTGKNGSYFHLRTTILSPEKTFETSKVIGYEIDQNDAVIFIGKDYDIAINKIVITVMTVAFMLLTLSLLREFVIILLDKDYKSKKETDKETRS